jgi:hypothetical protein
MFNIVSWKFNLLFFICLTRIEQIIKYSIFEIFYFYGKIEDGLASVVFYRQIKTKVVSRNKMKKKGFVLKLSNEGIVL